MVLAGVLHAQSTTSPSSSKSKPRSEPSHLSAPDPGSIANGLYHNSFFGFDYKLHFGWVDRTTEMREDSSADSSDPKKSILLLAAFEHPPEVAGDSVNSAVVVAAEAVSSYPGLQNAGQYFGPVTELTKAKGFTVVNEPYEFRVGAAQLVRGDFSKPLGSLTMHQSTLVMIEKGFVVSFTFIAGSEDEVDPLIEGLSFGRKETPAAHK
ncbi:MAG: hypothetical protein WA847_18510 [Terriglobales bacterium]